MILGILGGIELLWDVFVSCCFFGDCIEVGVDLFCFCLVECVGFGLLEIFLFVVVLLVLVVGCGVMVLFLILGVFGLFMGSIIFLVVLIDVFFNLDVIGEGEVVFLVD